MKIIHTADWHIGNSFFGYDRADEHRHFLRFLLSAAAEREADAIIVAGDVFDNPNPSAESQTIFNEFLRDAAVENPGIQIVVIAGNHDSAARLEAVVPLVESRDIYVRGSLHYDSSGTPSLDDLLIPLHSRTDASDEVVCLAVPFLRMADLAPDESFSRSMGHFFNGLIHEARHRYGHRQHLVLAAHFYATGSEINGDDHSERIIIGGEENVDASAFCRDLSYVALGHIHKSQRAAGLDYVRYSGSPLPMSFGERGYQHGINFVEISADGSVELTPLEYEPPRPLLTIPAKGTATPAQALEAIQSLPKGGRRDDSSRWPYVEVRLGQEPDSASMHSIKESFDGRAARFCTIRTQPAAQSADGDLGVNTEEQLRKLDPAVMMEKIYEDNNGGKQMPQALADKFATAVKIARQGEYDE